MSLNGNPVPISANSGSAMVDTASRRLPCHAPPPREAVKISPRGTCTTTPACELAVYRRRDRHCVRREIVQKVGRAVERVHDPDQPLGHDLRAQLLAHDPAARLRGEQHVRHDPLGGAVHLGDEVPAALGAPAARAGRPLDPAEVARRPLGGGLGQVQ